MKLRCTLSFFFSLGSFFYSSAQIPKDTIDVLQEITISATKDAQRIVRLPYAITLGKRSLLSSPQARTVPEALQGFTGVFVQKTNHAGGAPFLRGLTGNQSLIMVDGVRLNNSIFRYGPNQYLTLVQPGVVDRIEIIKGTGAVQYGSDALTGVICMQSRPLQYSAQPTWNSTSRFRWTSLDMERSARREIYYSGKRVALLLGGGISNYGDLKGGDTTGVQQPSGYRDESFDVKLQLALGKEWELSASTQWFRQRNVPVYHKYVLEDFVLHKSNPIARTLSYIKLTKALSSGFLRKVSIIYSSQRMEETRFSRKQSVITTRQEQDRVVTKGLSIDFSLQFTSFWRSNTGLDLYQDNVHSTRSDLDFFGVPINRLRGLYPDGARYMNASAYSLHHLQFNRFTFETGIRQTLYHASLTEASVGKVLYTPKALVVQAGISYRLFSQLYGYAQISEGFRAANIDDLGTLGIVDFRYEVPAYGLKPERSLNQEVGIKYHSTHFAGTASVFRIKLFDLITRIKTAAVIAGYDVYTKVNVDEGYIKGYEADIRYFLSSSWKLQAGATYLFGQSITRNEPLRRIPPFHTRVSLSYAKNRLEAIIHVDHAGKQSRLAQGDRDDNRIPFGGTPGFTVVHFQAGIRLKRIELQVMCHNLFNADYRLHGSGINGMGRAYSLSGLFSLYAQ